MPASFAQALESKCSDNLPLVLEVGGRRLRCQSTDYASIRTAGPGLMLKVVQSSHTVRCILKDVQFSDIPLIRDSRGRSAALPQPYGNMRDRLSSRSCAPR